MIRMHTGKRNLLHFAYGAVPLLVAIVTLGMWIPRTIPRLAFLPRPAERTYCSKTQGHSLETWHRGGPIWVRETVSDLMRCDVAAKSAAPSISPFPSGTTSPAQAGLPPDRLLNPESVGEKALAPLHLIRLELAVPNSWVEDENGTVLCTAIASGWNDCVPTAQAVANSITVDLYVDDGYHASVWLLDSAGTLASPIARLGEFSVDLNAVPAAESPRFTVLDVTAHLSPTVPRVGELASSKAANDRFVSGNWVVFDHARWVY
jgi:hypothetical protein